MKTRCKRDISCGYCHEDGHNKRHCPKMKAHWDANPQVHETYDHASLTGIDKTMFPTHYQNYWGDDCAKCCSSVLTGDTCGIALQLTQRQSQRNARKQSVDSVVLPPTTVVTVTS